VFYLGLALSFHNKEGVYITVFLWTKLSFCGSALLLEPGRDLPGVSRSRSPSSTQHTTSDPVADPFEGTDPTMRVQMQQEMCVIEALAFVTKSLVRAHKNKEEEFRVRRYDDIKYCLCRFD